MRPGGRLSPEEEGSLTGCVYGTDEELVELQYLQHKDRRAVQLLCDAAVILINGEHRSLVVLVDHVDRYGGVILILAV